MSADQRAVLAGAIDEFLDRNPVAALTDLAFRECRFDAGLAFVSFRPGCGGLGLDPALQPFVEERFLAAGAPDTRMRNIVGLGLAAPTLHAHGDPEHLNLLRPLYSAPPACVPLFPPPAAPPYSPRHA